MVRGAGVTKAGVEQRAEAQTSHRGKIEVVHPVRNKPDLMRLIQRDYLS